MDLTKTNISPERLEEEIQYVMKEFKGVVFDRASALWFLQVQKYGGDVLAELPPKKRGKK